MKKFFTTVLLLAGMLAAQAQTDQGTVMLGGSLGFSSSKTTQGDNDDDDDAETQFTFAPRAGYFLADNLALGLQLGITRSNRLELDGVGSAEGSTTTLEIGPFVRYYVPMANDNFSFFVQGEFGFGTTNYRAEDDDLDENLDDVTDTSVGVGISPGFTFFPSEKIGIDFQLQGFQINQRTLKNGDDDDNRIRITDIGFGVESFNPSIGINFFF